MFPGFLGQFLCVLRGRPLPEPSVVTVPTWCSVCEPECTHMITPSVSWLGDYEWEGVCENCGRGFVYKGSVRLDGGDDVNAPEITLREQNAKLQDIGSDMKVRLLMSGEAELYGTFTMSDLRRILDGVKVINNTFYGED